MHEYPTCVGQKNLRSIARALIGNSTQGRNIKVAELVSNADAICIRIRQLGKREGGWKRGERSDKSEEKKEGGVAFGHLRLRFDTSVPASLEGFFLLLGHSATRSTPQPVSGSWNEKNLLLMNDVDGD